MTDVPADDQNDMLLQRQLADEMRTSPVGQYTRADVELPPVDPADPVNRNLAMQLAIQNNPGATMSQLEAAANQFYGYLTQHN